MKMFEAMNENQSVYYSARSYFWNIAHFAMTLLPIIKMIEERTNKTNNNNNDNNNI